MLPPSGNRTQASHNLWFQVQRHARLPPPVQILSISCSLGEILAKIVSWRPLVEGWRLHLGEILDPPLMTHNYSCQYLERIDIEIIYFFNAQHLVCQNRVCSVINKKMLFLCHLRVKWIQNLTRMYSSGMRTTRLLTVPSMHCTGGVSAHGVGVSAYGGGGVCSGGVCPEGCLPIGVSAHGGVSARSVSAQSACIPACNGAEPPLPCGQTDTCENIIFA